MKTASYLCVTPLWRFSLFFSDQLLVVFTFLYACSMAFAGSATWKTNSTSGDWNNPANWTPRTVPNGASDIATFDSSTITAISFSSGAIVGGLIFNPGASPFTISVYGPGIPNLMFFGNGVTNNSGMTQQIVVSKDAASMGNGVYFNGSALAGVDVVYTNSGNLMNFFDSSSADHASITIDGNANAFGVVEFFATSTAGQATIVSNGAVSASPDDAGVLIFLENSTAGDGVITTNGGMGSGSFGGQTQFNGSSNAANAVLVANGGIDGGLGGRIFFLTDSTGGASQVKLFGEWCA